MPAPRREKPRVRRRRDAAVTAGLPQAGLGPIPPCLEALGTPWRLSPCPPEGSKAVSGHRPTLPFSNEETCPQDPWGLAPAGAYKLLLCSCSQGLGVASPTWGQGKGQGQPPGEEAGTGEGREAELRYFLPNN